MPQPFADALTQASADPIVVLDLDGPSSTPSDSPRVAQGLGAAGRPVTEDPSLPIGAAGPSGPAAAPVVSGPHVAPFPYAQTFTLHSLPGASKIIYLDFNGHTTPGNTAWGKTYNGGQPIITAPFDMDGNPDAFSEEEQRVIQRVWQRVAEDYAPFELDVTTQDPGDAALARSDESDQNYGTRAVIGPQAANLPGVGGYSYMGVFDSVGDYYKNVFVYSDNLLNREMNLGGAAAHEVGHPFGLNHDGTRGGSEYYEGHGTGAMKWGAIMGAGYDSYVLQWSKGDYYNASNTVEDDLAIIATGHGFGYRADDHGNTTAAASVLTANGQGVIAGQGIIERNTDVDVFRFTTTGGLVSLSVSPLDIAPDLDPLAKLYNSGGAVIATSDPEGAFPATFSRTLSAGTYYLSVEGVGWGDPLQGPPTGYTDYASLGQYWITGTVTDQAGPRVASLSPEPDATFASVTEIVAAFDEDLAAGAVSGTTFKVSSNAGGDTQWGTGDDTYVAGTVSYVSAGRAATFTPAAPLPDGTYGVWLDGTDGITDFIGNDLDGEYSGTLPSGNGQQGGHFVATFTVGGADKVAPRVTGLTPAPDSILTEGVSQIVMTVSEDLSPEIVNALNGKVWSYGGHFYMLTDTVKSWTQAEAYAVSLGGHLVTVNDAAEQAWLATNVFSGGLQQVWTGLTDVASEGTWGWSSGEPFTYSNWYADQPSSDTASDDYVEMYYFGEWNDTTPSGGRYGLIEWSGMDGDQDGVPAPVDLDPRTPLYGRSAWSLREDGADGIFGTADDVSYALSLSSPYTTGTSITLSVSGGPLSDGRYRLTAGSMLKDVAGNSLDGEYPGSEPGLPSGNGVPGGEFSADFTVDSTPPSLTAYALTDDTGVSATDKLTKDVTPTLTFTFSEPVFGQAADVSVSDPVGNPLAPDSVTGWGTNTLVASFTTPLTVDGGYMVRLLGTATIRDAAGHPLNGGWDEVLTFTLDSAGPQVIDMIPWPGSEVGLAVTVVVAFNEALVPDGVTANTFKVSSNPGGDAQWGTGDDTYVAGSVVYNATANQVTFTPPTPLLNGQFAAWASSALVDLAGNQLDGEFMGWLPTGDGVPGGDFAAPFTATGEVEVAVLSAANRRMVFRDNDGDTVTVAFAGKAGTATITRAALLGQPGDIQTIAFAGTDLKTSLTVTVNEKTGEGPGDGTTLQSVSGSGLGTLALRNVDVVGNGIHLAGALNRLIVDDIGDGADILLGGTETDQLTITADQVGDVDLTFAGILKSATVSQWAGGTIQVGRVGTLTVKKGNLGADVEADRIGTVKVTGGSLSGNLHAQNASAERPELGLALGSVTVTGGNITGAIEVDNQGSAGPISAKMSNGVGGQIGDGDDDTIQIAGRLASLSAAKGINAAITVDRAGTIEAKAGDIGQAITVNNEGGGKGNALNLLKAIGGSLFGAVEVLNSGNLGTLQARNIRADVTVDGKATLVRTELDNVVAPDPPQQFLATITLGGKGKVRGKNATIAIGDGGQVWVQA